MPKGLVRLKELISEFFPLKLPSNKKADKYFHFRVVSHVMSQNALIVFQCYLIQQFEVSCAGNHVWLTRHDASPPVVDDIPYQHTS